MDADAQSDVDAESIGVDAESIDVDAESRELRSSSLFTSLGAREYQIGRGNSGHPRHI